MEDCILNSIYKTVHGAFDAQLKGNPALVAPITLAYVGDTVYDLYIRTYLINSTDFTPAKLHKLAISMVCAKAQAKAFHSIENVLSEEEMRIYKRGRNAHSTVPHSASQSDYRTATGLESLLGYLYLKEQDTRLTHIMRIIIENLTEKTEKGE